MTDRGSLRGTRMLAGTAVLLALTTALQISGRYLTSFLGPANLFVVGTLVNACLLFAVDFAGIRGAAFIAFVTPFSALLTGAPIPLPFVPFIGVGNFLLVLLSYLFKNRVLGVCAGATAKFLFLFGSVVVFLKLADVPALLSGVLFFMFSWPQLATALMGGLIYGAVRRLIPHETIGR